ncbi:MAG: Uma2 family endonuclease [Vulcanimicrobiota bacterium]
MLHPQDGEHTWDDYLSWNDEKRWELIDGRAYAMSSPGVLHQRLVKSFGLQIESRLRGQTCEVFLSPMDVKLSDKNVVQPDLLVICRPEQIAQTHIEGAPTIVVEILSPSTAHHDRMRKINLYARFGVKEYWIVTPDPPMLELYVLDGATYRLSGVYNHAGEFTSPTIPCLKLDLAELFEPAPKPAEEARERPTVYYTTN